MLWSPGLSHIGRPGLIVSSGRSGTRKLLGDWGLLMPGKLAPVGFAAAVSQFNGLEDGGSNRRLEGGGRVMFFTLPPPLPSRIIVN